MEGHETKRKFTTVHDRKEDFLLALPRKNGGNSASCAGRHGRRWSSVCPRPDPSIAKRHTSVHPAESPDVPVPELRDGRDKVKAWGQALNWDKNVLIQGLTPYLATMRRENRLKIT